MRSNERQGVVQNPPRRRAREIRNKRGRWRRGGGGPKKREGAATTAKKIQPTKNRRRNQPAPTRHRQQQGRRGTSKPPPLQPIQLSTSSIHSHWKLQLGGLIRWYIHAKQNAYQSQEEVMQQIEAMYYASGFRMEETRDAMLKALGAEKEDTAEWVDVQMVVENDDGRHRLDVIQRSGEGPAHSSKNWNVAMVPGWAKGKSYFVQVVNRSNLNLSCAMTLDDQKVAYNAPVPSKSTRNVKPENRYFGQYEWLIQNAKRVKLQDPAHLLSNGNNNVEPAQGRPRSHRYNGIRPNFELHQRVNFFDYPDPCTCGWTFTGSVESSKVAFYEKTLNLGVVKLDFYYTTGTVKTALHHPTTGFNMLWRRCRILPEVFRQILRNPRFHSNIGYRTRDAQPEEKEDVHMQEDEDDYDQPIPEDDESMAVSDTCSVSASAAMANDTRHANIFFAKQDDYDFQKQGHVNRQEAMARLQPTGEFQAWEQAALKEFSVIHCKFYISEAKRKGNRESITTSKPRELAPLPEMKPVIDVKATEKVTLSTELRWLGLPRAQQGARVRMERIPVNDHLPSGPVFEYKLFYREDCGDVAAVTDEVENSSIGSVEDVKDSTNEMEEEDNVPLVEKLRHEVPLAEYKEEKIGQLNIWHSENNAQDKDSAEAKLQSSQVAITAAPKHETVDEHVKSYFDWHQKQRWIITGTRL
jgi:hypothetical protein